MHLFLYRVIFLFFLLALLSCWEWLFLWSYISKFPENSVPTSKTGYVKDRERGMNRAQGIRMMTSFHYNYQNALGQAIVFRFFFCEESLARDTNLHNKDSSEMHSGSCKGLRSHGIKITKYEWILESHNPLRARSPHATTDKIFFLAKLSSTQTLYKYR